MADEPGTTEPEAVPSEGGEGETLGHLSERVDRLAGMLERFLEGGGGQRQQEAEAEAPDIKAEVRAAVREVQAKDKAKAEKEAEAKSLQDQIDGLKAKVETPPFEYRPVTNRMGWAKP